MPWTICFREPPTSGRSWVRFYPPSGVKLRPSERRYKPYIVVLLVRYRLAKGCCETPNFGNWWFEPVFSRRMVPEGVGFGVAGVTAGPATRQGGDHSRWPNSPPAWWTRIDRSQCTAEDQRLPRSSARRRLHASGNRNGERVGCRFCVWGEP